MDTGALFISHALMFLAGILITALICTPSIQENKTLRKQRDNLGKQLAEARKATA